MKSLLTLAFAVGVLPQMLLGQELTNSQIKQKLLEQPPQAILALAQKEGAPGSPAAIDVAFAKADLNGDGSFNYLIALYMLDRDGGVLRVFKIKDGDLIVAGEQAGRRYAGGYGTQFDLIDVNGDGIPEVMVTFHTASGRDELFNLFIWTGSSLQDMLGTRVESGSLVDIDNDGILEIVHPRPDGDGFEIFKLSGNAYQFFKTVPQDPSGLTGGNGKINYVRAFCRTLEPQQFPTDDIRHALAGKSKEEKGEGHGQVHLTFGGLERVNAGPVAVEQIDTTTISVGPHLTPIRVSIHPARTEDRERERGHHKDGKEICEKDQGRISVEIARTDFLKGLQRLHLDGPLAAGDTIEVRLTARLKDGTPVGAVFTAKIVGDGDGDDRDEDHHRDKGAN